MKQCCIETPNWEKGNPKTQELQYLLTPSLQKDKWFGGIVSRLLLTGHYTTLNQSVKRCRGKAHVPPDHHPPRLHAAQLHMLLSHSPTATSSENHAPLAYHRKGNTWREGEKGRHGHTHTHTQRPNEKEVRQWTENNQRVDNRREGK